MSLARSARHVARFDSSTVLLDALAAHLRGESLPSAGLPVPSRALMLAANRLPRSARGWLYSAGGAIEAARPSAAAPLKVDEVARWLVSRYPDRRYPGVAIGSSNGAFVHLAAALGIPWLPQTFLVPVRHSGIHPDDLEGSMRWGIGVGESLAGGDERLQVHHMHDPNQDRLMIARMAYFRIKLRDLPPAYERFVREHLAEGAPLLVVEGNNTWPSREVGPRRFFQPGATGGAMPGEYIGGSERVRRFLAEEGSPFGTWCLPGDLEHVPEAEWGFEPALLGPLGKLAGDLGSPLVRLRFDEPEDLSPAVADLYRHWFEREGLPADRAVVETFFLLEPHLAIAKARVPFWVRFSVQPALEHARRYLAGRAFGEVRGVMFPHGVRSVGVALPEDWLPLFSDGFLGTDPDQFPRDFASLVRFHRAFSRLDAPDRAPSALGLDEGLDRLEANQGGYGYELLRG